MRALRLVVSLALLLVPALALAGGQRPGPRETVAQQRATKATKERQRYGKHARVQRISISIAGGGRLKGILVDRPAGVYARTTEVEPAASGAVTVKTAESMTVAGRETSRRAKATRIVHAKGARMTETSAQRTNVRSGTTRRSEGSSFRGGGNAWGMGTSTRD